MAVALAAGLVGLAVAQQRQPGGGGGFGGFGQTGPAQLINSKTVQADLKATDEQVTKLKDWAKAWGTKSREMMQEKLKDVPMEERFQKMAAINAEISKMAYEEIGKVIDEKQVKRLKQIELQMAGTRAFTMKDVSEALKVTEEQTTKMREITMASFKDRQELNEEYGIKGFGGGGGAKLEGDKLKEYQKKSEAINKDVETKTLAVLTDEQKKKFEEMIGEKVDVAKIRQEMPAAGGFGGKRKKDD
jgi:hypothetical protein